MHLSCTFTLTTLSQAIGTTYFHTAILLRSICPYLKFLFIIFLRVSWDKTRINLFQHPIRPNLRLPTIPDPGSLSDLNPQYTPT